MRRRKRVLDLKYGPSGHVRDVSRSGFKCLSKSGERYQTYLYVRKVLYNGDRLVICRSNPRIYWSLS